MGASSALKAGQEARIFEESKQYTVLASESSESQKF